MYYLRPRIPVGRYQGCVGRYRRSNGLKAQRSEVVADAAHDLGIHLNTSGHLREG